MCKLRRSQLGALMHSNIKGGGHPEAAVCVGDGVPERRQGGVWHLRGGGVSVFWGMDPDPSLGLPRPGVRFHILCGCAWLGSLGSTGL